MLVATVLFGGCNVLQPKLAMPRIELPKINLNPWAKPKTPKPAESFLLRSIEQLTPDGTFVPLADQQRTTFQILLHDRLPPGSTVTSIVALEVDLPEGDGFEGSYLAILLGPYTAELRYYEQRNHHPRLDRFYRRTLTAEELATLDALAQDHAFEELLPAEIADGPANGYRFRITIARAADTKTTEIPVPEAEAPAGRLISALRHLRDGADLTCVYFQPLPKTAQLLFADPFRPIAGIWAKRDDVRILVTDEKPHAADERSSPLWLAQREQAWVATDAPPEEDMEAVALRAETAAAKRRAPLLPPVRGTTKGALIPQDVDSEAARPTTLSASQPALPPGTSPPVVAEAPSKSPAEPSPFSLPDMLPHDEYWWTEASGYSTVVWHYVPVSAVISNKVGFTVPGLIFDDTHMAVDSIGGWLYIVHDGVLFRLPIPDLALTQR